MNRDAVVYAHVGLFKQDVQLAVQNQIGISKRVVIALVSYEGNNAQELIADFHGAVDDYLELCAQQGKEPERAYKGSFNVRISPELHKQAVVAAMSHNMTLNSFVESSIAQAVHAGA